MMRCYCHVPESTDPSLTATAGRIRSILDRPDVVVTTNRDAQATAAESPRENEPALERMDAFIIEGTTSDAEIGFLLAHAIALKKPTLYLYQRGTVAKVFSHLALHELPTWIKVVSYHDKSLERHVEQFLMQAGGKSIRPTPRIKFTLRITSLIEEYLNQKTLNTKTSKADWLRDQLEHMMDQDQDWQRHLRRRASSDE